MTVENTQNKMPPLQMGTATEYPFTFAVLLQDPTEEEALEAIKASVLLADGTEIELEYGADYTVTLNTDRIGGTLTVNNVRTSGDYITIYRQYEQTQEVDYKDFNAAPAETFEQCFDKLTMLSQQQQEEINRSLKLNVSSTIVNPSLPEPIANNTLIWDSEGTGLDNYDIIGENNQFKAEVNSAIATGQAEIQAQFDTLEAQVNAGLTDGLQNIQTQLDDFEEEINTDIADVREAADKINQLEESVATATTAATNAQNSATNALNSANAASQLVQDAEETLQTRADVDLSNLSATGQAKFDAKANLDLSNLSETGEKHFLNKTQITNCLLEIPQNIKLELNDGTLTLKSGSKVIVPNGFEADGTTPKFDYVTIESDVTSTGFTGYTFTPFCFYVPSLNMIIFDGEYTGTGTNGYQYDTTTNRLTYKGTTSQAGLENATLAYPIGLINMDATVGIKSINQIFNGFGYIGSTIWVDKGVKYLIPNGRNDDGSLKNIQYTTSKVSTIQTSYATNNAKIGLGSIGNINYVQWNNVYYDKETNYNRLYSSKAIWGGCTVGNIIVDSNLKVSSISMPQTFRAVDYNDALLKTDKEEITSWSVPNYNAGIAISSGYIAANNGYVIFTLSGYLAGGYGNGFVNDVKVADFYISAGGEGTVKSVTVGVPVQKGDKVTFGYGGSGGASSAVFYPIRG